MKKQAGRPTRFTWVIAEEICERLSNGEPLTVICKSDQQLLREIAEMADGRILPARSMPAYATVMNWLWRESPFRDKFVEMYTRARVMQADCYADQIIQLADESKNADHSIAQRLKVDARKWIAAKLNPRKYSDRVTNVHELPSDAPQEITYKAKWGANVETTRPDADADT